ncbi:unnamed protein product [Penicillium olsonii]|uniref:Glycosyl transferase CAP10 domain-containing protein n=1 Tax=Penicillium olsonii TaxID=99116 RepID=A0A9W4I6L2_PENOL|nr:unnamed protein product [Penicillium olsonii]CAG8247325.1 unnamed protein product [Penicillium olsonii]
MNLLQSLQAGVMAIFDIPGAGPRGQHNYNLLSGAREKSQHYYSRTTKKTRTVACAVAAVIFFLWCFPLLPANYNRVADEYLCDHPISILASNARQVFNETLMRQSKSLGEAVAEYQRRYDMPPPPHFDKWYEFAEQRNTMLIDEYDAIYHALLPFWGLSPSTIRSRVKEDLGFDNVVMGISIRNGEPIHLGNGQGNFQRDAAMKQFGQFAQWLPDMDLEFNVHDEPRVVVPHQDLHRLVLKGHAAHADLNRNPLVDRFSSNNDTVEPIPEVLTTRFLNIEKQETWLYSRLSCPPDSPTMDLDGNAPENTSTFALEPLGFIFNQSASSDICNNPSLHRRLGIFEWPNAFKLTNELVGGYDPEPDIPWEWRKSQLYWRGTTTGGHSHGGSWHNLQRQHRHQILERKEESTCRFGGDEGWKARIANQTDLGDYFNTHFVDIVDCEEESDAEWEHFNVVDREDHNEAWGYRYILDMDGHAYSGRFYAFMRSKSVPLKLTFFREWHQELLFPWVHYVPLNKDVNEIPEIVRFEQDPAGQEIAQSIGEEGQSWAAKVLRNDDMDVYMFRLMLEYARVQDDQRQHLGFISPGPVGESLP